MNHMDRVSTVFILHTSNAYEIPPYTHFRKHELNQNAGAGVYYAFQRIKTKRYRTQYIKASMLCRPSYSLGKFRYAVRAISTFEPFGIFKRTNLVRLQFETFQRTRFYFAFDLQICFCFPLFFRMRSKTYTNQITKH